MSGQDNTEKNTLLIQSSIPDITTIVNNLKENKIFSRVVVFDKAGKEVYGLRARIFELLYPATYLLNFYHIRFNSKEFDRIYIPKINHVIGTIYSLNKNAEVVLYEDGLGSYFENDFKKFGSKKFTLLYKLINGDGLLKNNDTILLAEPSLIVSKDMKAKGLPDINRQYYRYLNIAFNGIKTTPLLPITWLSQNTGTDRLASDDEKLLYTLTKYKEDVLYRPHPRFGENGGYGFKHDNIKEPLELKVLKTHSSGSYIMISYLSTASIMPKVLFNKDMFIIFTCLIKDPNLEGFDLFFEKFSKLFSSKRVFAPKSREEFIDLLDNITKGSY